MNGFAFGVALRTARGWAGHSLKTLSSKSGVTQAHLSRLENGKTQPTVEYVEKIARGLGMEGSFLFALALGIVIDRDPQTGDVRSCSPWRPQRTSTLARPGVALTKESLSATLHAAGIQTKPAAARAR